MKRTYKLEGLECANCAAKMEDAIGTLGGVRSASVNFLAAKMTIEGEDACFEEIANAARAVVRRFEPDVVVRSA